jgi:hypothetical protein
MIMEVIDQHLTPRERLQHGQILWHAIDLNERPSRNKPGAKTRKVPVILTLHDLNDVEDCLQNARPASHWSALRLKRALRMSHEAHAQGGLLGNVDLSLLLGLADSVIASAISNWEDTNHRIVPRRTTLHDVGSGVTHKRMICKMRYLEGKEPPEVARASYHTLESVDRYLGQYDRVRHCRQQGMSAAQSAHILGCGQALVRQYLEIDDEINQARAAKTAKTDQAGQDQSKASESNDRKDRSAKAPKAKANDQRQNH